jgi:heme/copper-type cytochrome/quinol oxidase subunit 2
MDSKDLNVTRLQEDKHTFITTTATVVFVLSFISVLSVVIFHSFDVLGPKQSEVPTVNASTAVEVPFDYEISQIDESLITLTGDKGSMRLPFNPNIVTVYSGSLSAQKTISLSDLSVGQKVTLKVVPGQYAWLYVLD